MDDATCIMAIRLGMAAMVKNQSPEGEDIDLWRALFSCEEQEGKVMLFSEVLEKLPPATNSHQAIGRFIMEVVHGFVRCITPGMRPPVSLSFAEALAAPRIEAQDKQWQPWKPGRMHQVIWARGVLEAYARLHGTRSLLTALLSLNEILSEAIQERPGSSSANAACNARRLWIGASNLNAIITAALALSNDFVQACLKTFIWADQSMAGFLEQYVLWQYSVALGCNDETERRAGHALWHTAQQQKECHCHALEVQDLLVLFPNIQKNPEAIISAVITLLVNSRQMSCGNALLFDQISNAWRTVVKGFATGISPADLNSTLRMCFVLASESPFPPSSTSLKDLGEISQDEFQRLTLDATALLEQVLKSLPTCCRITDCPLVLRTLAEITTETEHVRAIPFEVRLYRPARAANLFMVIIMWLAPEFVSIPAACGLMRMAVLSKQSSLGMGDLHVASCFSVGLKRWTEKMWRSSSDDALLNTYVSCGVSFTDLIPEDLFGRPAWVCMYLKGQGLGCLQPAVFHQLQLKRWRPQMHSLSFMSTWPNNSDTGFIDEDEESRYLHELRCLLFTYRTPHGQPPERLPGINTFNHLAGLLKHVENCPADQCLAARHVIIENIKMEFALSSWPEPSEDQLGYMANSLMIMTDEKTHPPGHELILYTFDEEKAEYEEAAKRVGQAAVALILQEERERVAAAKTSSAQMHVNSAKKVKGKKAAGKKAGGR
ncbi:hypothetical protein WJX84_008307 [Apatococcus fuscideae]|uniref:Uncharacterized protein n=1 Tax=Apatococcus fuscideae TaxID=2026836 RepID=A0AAW1SPZ4_9CHLO